jgi:hypothetical protein
MKYLVYIVKHREDPAFTLEQAGEVKITDLLSDSEDEVPPTSDAAGGDADAASDQTDG